MVYPMNKLKSSIALLSAVALMVGFTACGGGGTASSGSTTASGGSSGSGSTSSKTFEVNSELDAEEPEGYLPLPDKLENPNLRILLYPHDGMEAVIKLFEEKYGGTVDLVDLSGGNYYDNVVARVSAGDYGDLVNFEEFAQPGWAISNVLQPIDDYITFRDMDFSKSQMANSMWYGKYYGMQSKTEPLCTIYNERLFKEAGLTTPREYYEKGEWNWDTFTEVAKELTVRDNKGQVVQWGFNTLYLEVFSQANGAKMYDITKDGKINIAFDKKPFVEFLELLQEAQYGDKSFYPVDKAWDAPFASGEVAMLGVSPGLYETIANRVKDPVGIAPLPTGPSNDGTYPGGVGNYYGMTVGAKNPEGAVVFFKMWNQYYRDQATAPAERLKKYSSTVTEEYFKEIINLPTNIGSIQLITSPWDLVNPIRIDGKPIQATIDSYKPKAQAAIDDILKK